MNIFHIIKGLLLVKQFPQEQSLNLKDAQLLEVIKAGDKKVKVYHLNLGAKTPFLFAAAGTRGFQYFILVDDNYISLPDAAKKAILYHEVGHIANGDFDGATMKALKIAEKIGATCDNVDEAFKCYVQCLLENRSIEQEYAADAYAAQIVGIEPVALKLQMFNRLFGGSNQEIKDRYQKLTGNSLENPLISMMKNAPVVSLEDIEE